MAISRVKVLLVLAAILTFTMTGGVAYAQAPNPNDLQLEQTPVAAEAYIEIGGVRTRIATGDRFEVSQDGASQPPDRRFRRWAKSEINDFLGIDLALVLAGMDYYVDENSVKLGHNPRFRCDVLRDGWIKVSCDTTWRPVGPDIVSSQQEGIFDHHVIQPARHWLMARFEADLSGGDYICEHSGHVWGVINWKCTGSRFSH